MVLLFLIVTQCQKEDAIVLEETKAEFKAPSIIDAKNNFLQKSTLNVKDVNTILQSRDLQTSLTVDWDLSKTKKYKEEPEQAVDILYTPIYINNDAQAKMFIGSVEHNGVIESNLFCLIYTDTENTTSFSGYFLRFNLDGILLDAKKYINGVITVPSTTNTGGLGRNSSDCTDFSQLLNCLIEAFGDADFWHLGGELDEVVVIAYIDAGPSGPGGSGDFSTLLSPFHIPAIDNGIGSTGSDVGLPWWSASYVTANAFNILQWLEINPLTPQGQFLLNEASSNLLQDIANFLNDNMYRIRDEFPDLDGFDPVNNNNANTGYAISEEAIDDVIEAIDTLADGECAILQTVIDLSEIEADFDQNLFGDYPAPVLQQNHDAIQQQFNNLRNANGNLAAVNYLISTYNMNTFGTNSVNFNYSISFENGLSNGAHANAIRGFNSNGIMVSCNIEIDTNLLSFTDFGYITRVIKHEIYHVLQGVNYGQFNISNAAQEFDAYYFQIFGFRDLKKIQDGSIITGLAIKMINYMKELSNSERQESQSKITLVEQTFPELCND